AVAPLRLIRTFGAGLILAVAVILALSIAPRYHELSTLTDNPDPARGELTPRDQAALDELGISADAYAAYITILESVVCGACIAIAGFVYWRKRGDPFAIFIAIGLTSFGTLAFPNSDALIAASPGWTLPITALRANGYICLILFFLLFPDGRFVP